MKFDLKNIAKDWILYQYDEAQEYSWAIHKVWDLVLLFPESCWEFIMIVISDNDDDFILTNLAAGPLESLLVNHGNKIILLLETEAAQNLKFKSILKNIWQNDMPDEIWERVQKAAK